jgi:hypothetical protein
MQLKVRMVPIATPDNRERMRIGGKKSLPSELLAAVQHLRALAACADDEERHGSCHQSKPPPPACRPTRGKRLRLGCILSHKVKKLKAQYSLLTLTNLAH